MKARPTAKVDQLADLVPTGRSSQPSSLSLLFGLRDAPLKRTCGACQRSALEIIRKRPMASSRTRVPLPSLSVPRQPYPNRRSVRPRAGGRNRRTIDQAHDHHMGCPAIVGFASPTRCRLFRHVSATMTDHPPRRFPRLGPPKKPYRASS
jgi:hypothetical protein